MLIQNEEEMDTTFQFLLLATRVAVDTETVSLEDKTAIGVSMYTEVDNEVGIGCYIPFRHQHEALFGGVNMPISWMKKYVVPIITDPQKHIIYHNAKFDIKVFENEGINLPLNWWDTMLMAHMVDENEFSYTLKGLGKKYIEDEAAEDQFVIKKLVKQLGGWEKVPPDIMGKYAVQDTRLTYKLFEMLYPNMKMQKLLDLWPREREFALCLKDIEDHGILIDIDRAKELSYESRTRMQEIADSLGFDPSGVDDLADFLFNELGIKKGPITKRKTKRWPNGQPKMDNAFLKKYENWEPIQQILEFRGHQKADSTWFHGFIEKVHEDGRLHPNFKQHGTVTTRLSCAEPNLQQLPRVANDGVKKQVKTILRAEEGMELWEYDYSQVEYRLSICYGKDEAGIAAYQSGSDMHSLTAELLDIDRHDAKTLNFAILYGAGSGKVAEMLKINSSDAMELIDNFWSEYPGLADAVARATKAAYSQRWVPLWTGRRRHFRFPDEAHKAFNSVIQGGAAEIMKTTMIKMRRELPELGIASQVHDALWFELPVGDEQIHRDIVRIMEWPTEEFPIPFKVEAKKMYPLKEADRE